MRADHLIRIFTFDQRILGELLEEARTEFKAAKENVVSVWASNKYALISISWAKTLTP